MSEERFIAETEGLIEGWSNGEWTRAEALKELGRLGYSIDESNDMMRHYDPDRYQLEGNI